MLPRALPRRRLAGFTLIELLVVIIIIGILVAIGVPAYLAYQAKAKDTDAKSALTVAYKAAVAGDGPVNNGRFGVASSIVSDIHADEPAASVARGDCLGTVANAPVKQVLVDPSSTANAVTLCTRSGSGTVWKLVGPLTGNPALVDGSQVPLTFAGTEITDAVRAAKLQGDGLPADSSTGVWDATTNMVPRSYFDGVVRNTNPPSGWFTGADTTNGASASITKVADPAFPVDSSSIAEVAINHPGAGWAYVADGIGTAPFTVGQTYTVSFWASQFSGTLGTPFVIVEDSDGTNVVMAARNFTLTSSPQRYTFTFTAGVAGNHTVVFVGTNAGANGVMHITGMQVEQMPTATPYVATAGAPASRAISNGVQAPVSALDPAQGWFAIRVRVDWSSSSYPTAFPGWFKWGNTLDTSANRLLLYSPQSNPKQFAFERSQGSQQTAASQTLGSLNAGDLVTVVCSWDATTENISVNGAAFTSRANTSTAPVGLKTFFLIGGADHPGDSDVLWFAAGKGTLSNADAATINGFGNSDPKRASFPASAQATMVWDGTSPTGSLK